MPSGAPKPKPMSIAPAPARARCATRRPLARRYRDEVVGAEEVMKGRTGVERVVVLVERIDQGKEVGEDRANDVQSDPTNASQKSSPRGSRFSGFSTRASSSSTNIWLKLLTADPRVHDVDDEVKDEVDKHDAHRDHQDNALDQQVVAGVDGGDQGVAEPRNIQQILDDETSRQQTADVHTRRAEQGD